MSKVLLAGILVGMAGGLLLVLSRRKDDGEILNRVADEGYETAHDILFPEKGKSKKLRVGPILP